MSPKAEPTKTKELPEEVQTLFVRRCEAEVVELLLDAVQSAREAQMPKERLVELLVELTKLSMEELVEMRRPLRQRRLREQRDYDED